MNNNSIFSHPRFLLQFSPSHNPNRCSCMAMTWRSFTNSSQLTCCPQIMEALCRLSIIQARTGSHWLRSMPITSINGPMLASNRLFPVQPFSCSRFFILTLALTQHCEKCGSSSVCEICQMKNFFVQQQEKMWFLLFLLQFSRSTAASSTHRVKQPKKISLSWKMNFHSLSIILIGMSCALLPHDLPT